MFESRIIVPETEVDEEIKGTKRFEIKNLFAKIFFDLEGLSNEINELSEGSDTLF